MTNRRRRLNPEEKKSHRQAFNFLIQSLAADMIRVACNKVRKVGLEHPQWELKIISIIHDEILMEVNESYQEEIAPIISEVMATAMNLPIRMPVEIGFGKTLSEAK
jgi:DNA polymerase-1